VRGGARQTHPVTVRLGGQPFNLLPTLTAQENVARARPKRDKARGLVASLRAALTDSDGWRAAAFTGA
jgi:hypothetical protein